MTAAPPTDTGAQRRGVLDWLFRDRTTGGITVAQVPNAPLLVWLGATVLGVFWAPQVAGHDVLPLVGTAGLLVWAGDEVVRGVNPFRRLLGVGVLAWQAWSFLRG